MQKRHSATSSRGPSATELSSVPFHEAVRAYGAKKFVAAEPIFSRLVEELDGVARRGVVWKGQGPKVLPSSIVPSEVWSEDARGTNEADLRAHHIKGVFAAGAWLAGGLSGLSIAVGDDQEAAAPAKLDCVLVVGRKDGDVDGGVEQVKIGFEIKLDSELSDSVVQRIRGGAVSAPPALGKYRKTPPLAFGFWTSTGRVNDDEANNIFQQLATEDVQQARRLVGMQQKGFKCADLEGRTIVIVTETRAVPVMFVKQVGYVGGSYPIEQASALIAAVFLFRAKYPALFDNGLPTDPCDLVAEILGPPGPFRGSDSAGLPGGSDSANPDCGGAAEEDRGAEGGPPGGGQGGEGGGGGNSGSSGRSNGRAAGIDGCHDDGLGSDIAQEGQEASGKGDRLTPSPPSPASFPFPSQPSSALSISTPPAHRSADVSLPHSASSSPDTSFKADQISDIEQNVSSTLARAGMLEFVIRDTTFRLPSRLSTSPNTARLVVLAGIGDGYSGHVWSTSMPGIALKTISLGQDEVEEDAEEDADEGRFADGLREEQAYYHLDRSARDNPARLVLPSFFGSFGNSGLLLLAFERIQGRSFLSWAELAKKRSDVSHALDQLHSLPITHGDLRPANSLLSTDGRIRLCDLGRAVCFLDANTAVIFQRAERASFERKLANPDQDLQEEEGYWEES
ncbi:hypothetical protein JCM11251_007185 [Rhodosporidiobolus azoricus]